MQRKKVVASYTKAEYEQTGHGEKLELTSIQLLN